MKWPFKCAILKPGDNMKKEDINRLFDEMIDSIPKIKISTFVSQLKSQKENSQ